MEAKVDCSKERLIARFEYKPSKIVNVTCVVLLICLVGPFVLSSHSDELLRNRFLVFIRVYHSWVFMVLVCGFLKWKCRRICEIVHVAWLFNILKFFSRLKFYFLNWWYPSKWMLDCCDFTTDLVHAGLFLVVDIALSLFSVLKYSYKEALRKL